MTSFKIMQKSVKWSSFLRFHNSCGYSSLCWLQKSNISLHFHSFNADRYTHLFFTVLTKVILKTFVTAVKFSLNRAELQKHVQLRISCYNFL